MKAFFEVSVFSGDITFVLLAEHEEAEGGGGCSRQHEAADVGAVSL